MVQQKAKKKRKPIRYKTVTFTVTAKQKKSLMNFCRSRRTTPAKLIKNAIRPCLQNYSDLKVEKHPSEKVNQLQLF